MATISFDILNNSLCFIILLIFMICGYKITLVFLYCHDSRIYDIHGKYVPGSISHLWGRNYYTIIKQAIKDKQISLAICDKLLYELGSILNYSIIIFLEEYI